MTHAYFVKTTCIYDCKNSHVNYGRCVTTSRNRGEWHNGHTRWPRVPWLRVTAASCERAWCLWDLGRALITRLNVLVCTVCMYSTRTPSYISFKYCTGGLHVQNLLWTPLQAEKSPVSGKYHINFSLSHTFQVFFQKKFWSKSSYLLIGKLLKL